MWPLVPQAKHFRRRTSYAFLQVVFVFAKRSTLITSRASLNSKNDFVLCVGIDVDFRTVWWGLWFQFYCFKSFAWHLVSTFPCVEAVFTLIIGYGLVTALWLSEWYFENELLLWVCIDVDFRTVWWGLWFQYCCFKSFVWPFVATSRSSEAAFTLIIGYGLDAAPWLSEWYPNPSSSDINSNFIDISFIIELSDTVSVRVGGSDNDERFAILL